MRTAAPSRSSVLGCLLTALVVISGGLVHAQNGTTVLVSPSNGTNASNAQASTTARPTTQFLNTTTTLAPVISSSSSVKPSSTTTTVAPQLNSTTTRAPAAVAVASTTKAAPVATAAPVQSSTTTITSTAKPATSSPSTPSPKGESVLNASSTTVSPTKIIITENIDNQTSSTNASSIAPLSFLMTWDFMPENIRNNGGVIVHILLLAYICLALGIVCDIYFLSSLEFISNGLKLPADIAGATFMAVGTSAPELFTSLIGVFISQDDIGTGTILGSAVFNIIFIPAVCGFAVWKWCNEQPKVSKFAILRDTIFYLITIVTLLLSLKDNQIDWIESLSMLGLFIIYIIIMYFNAQVSELLRNNDESGGDGNTESTPLLTSQNAVLVQSSRGDEWEVGGGDKGGNSGNRQRYSSVSELIEEEQDWVESSMLMKVLMFPALILFKITLPKATKYCFILTFIVSILWISVLTYAAVWLVQIIGYTFGVPDTISGLTLLAAGTSIPELISSVLVVKRAGLADMALCNTIGSNIFDILVGLGLPWFIKSLIGMISLSTLEPTLTLVPVQSTGLPFTTFSLLITVVAMIGTLSAFKWRLGLGVGVVCSIIYVIFLVAASIIEIVLN